MANPVHSADYYRRLKKKLTPYFNFSFRMPRKGKDFTPQQKSRLTRANNQFESAINQVRRGRYSFVKTTSKTKQLSKNFKKTNKGFFVPEGGATVVEKIETRTDSLGRKRKVKVAHVKTMFRKRKTVFIPLPEYVYDDINNLPYFMLYLHDNYPRLTFTISIRGRIGGQVFSVAEWGYFTAAFNHFGYEKGTRNAIDGVWAIWFGDDEYEALIHPLKHEEIKAYIESQIKTD